MDNQTIQPTDMPQVPAPPQPHPASTPPAAKPATAESLSSRMWPALLVSLAVLIAGGAVSFVFMSSFEKQSKKQDQQLALQQKTYDAATQAATYQSDIKSDQYQAIFLTGGQVYFGKVTKMDNVFLTLKDIYYLRVSGDLQPTSGSTNTSSKAATDVSLAKLGSELHGPEDQMDIKMSTIQFIENLKNDSQVTKAITAYKKN